MYALTMGLSAGALIFGYGNTDRESFREWARREAVARERIVEEGGELEFGKFYSSKEGYVVESIDVMPVKGGSVEEEEQTWNLGGLDLYWPLSVSHHYDITRRKEAFGNITVTELFSEVNS